VVHFLGARKSSDADRSNSNGRRLGICMCDNSKKSARKLETHMKDNVKLCVALVEIAAMSDAGLPFCRTCYICEGDSPLVFSAEPSLAQLDRIVRDPERCGFGQLKRASEEAETIMASGLEPYQDTVIQLDERSYRAINSGGQSEEDTEANIDLAEKNVTEAEAAFVEFT
jgi:hypothetical protein